MRLLRIAFDAKRAFHNATGLGNYSRTLIRSVAEQAPQNKYLLCTPSVTDRFSMDVDGGGTEVILPQGPASLLSGLWRSFLISSVLKKRHVDIFHGLSNEIPFGLRKHGIATVVTIHDLIFMRHPEFYSGIDRAVYSQKVDYACKQADRIVAISRQTKNDIVELLGVPAVKIDVVYQTCDAAFNVPVTEQDKFECRSTYALPASYLLYIGTIEPRKNLETIIRALPALHDQQMPLLVVGRSTSYLDSMKRLIADLHVSDRVLFRHEVHSQHLPSIYRQAAMLVYPSLYEGFGIPIIEALSAGTPVITSKGGCFEEAGGPGSIYVDPLDHEILAQRINDVSERHGLREEMVSKGRAHVHQFNRSSMVDAIMQTYTKALHD